MLPRLKCASKYVRIEQDRALVEGLRLGQLVARVADVGEVDERRHQIRIVFERAAVGLRRLLLPLRRPIVEQRSHQEILLGARVSGRAGQQIGLSARRRGAVRRRTRLAASASMMRAGCASMRKSNASWPERDRLQIAQHRAERQALLQLAVQLAQQRSDR